MDIEIASDLAMNLPEDWVGHGTAALVTGIFGWLGLTIAVARGWGRRAFKWLFHRVADSNEPEPTTSIFRGRRSKHAALIAYLEGRQLSDKDVKSIANFVLHEARTFASEANAHSGDPTTRARYEAAYRRLTDEGKPPLDVVYAGAEGGRHLRGRTRCS